MISRFYSSIEPLIIPNRVLVIYGPRRVGKTTILNTFLQNTRLKYKLDSGENVRVQEILGSNDFQKIKEYVSDYELIAIDEAQHIDNIGMGLKIIVDQIPGIKVVVTGSSSFDLANQIGEPLTGRKMTITVYPFAQVELKEIFNRYEINQRLHDFMVYGSYPDAFLAPNRDRKIAVLNELVDSYLMKDVLALDKIKKSKTLIDLVRLLALQIGSEVSLTELSTQLNTNVRTIEKYIDVLEKGFIIVSLGSLRRNLRNEIRGKKKYYFYDNGIRNALISQFGALENRNDVGALWENFMFIERLKTRSYKNIYANMYFWRTYDQKEIDLVEERDGKFSAYEFKWSPKIPRQKMFLKSYPGSSLDVVDRDNYLDFLI